MYHCSAVRCRRPPADRGIASEDEEAGQHGDAAGQGPRCHGRIAVQKKQHKTKPDHGAHRAHGSLHAGDCGARGYVQGWGEDATGTKDRLSSSFRRPARWDPARWDDAPTPRPHPHGVVSSKRLGRAALKPRPVWSARPSAIRSLTHKLQTDGSWSCWDRRSVGHPPWRPRRRPRPNSALKSPTRAKKAVSFSVRGPRRAPLRLRV